MYTCMRTYECMRKYNIHIHIYTYTYTYRYTHTYTYTHIYICIHTHIYTYVYMYVYIIMYEKKHTIFVFSQERRALLSCILSGEESSPQHMCQKSPTFSAQPNQ